MQNIHKQAVSGGRDPQQAHPPKGSMDPGHEPWRQQAATAGRAAGADGECSPEPGKPQTDGETRRSGSFQARDPPGCGAQSGADPGAPGKLRSPSPANSSGPGAPRPRPQQPRVRFLVRTSGLRSRKMAQTHKALPMLRRGWTGAAVSSGKRSLRSSRLDPRSKTASRDASSGRGSCVNRCVGNRLGYECTLWVSWVAG